MSSGAYTIRWIAAWALALVLLGQLTRTRLGYALVYYLAALAILFVVVTQYKRVGAILAPLEATSSQGGA